MGPTDIALRIPACAWNDQFTQPLWASSEYTTPVSELKKTLPSTIAGCWYIDDAPGIPNAHFSFSLETCPVVSPAALPGWKRVFALSTPQPFQAGAEAASFTAAG